MDQHENLGSFIKENAGLVREWIDLKIKVYRLQLIRFVARTAGYLVWTIISLFFLFLLLIFIGLTTGFWLSSLTGSYIAGFGIVTGGLALLLLVLAIYRRKIFINPIIRQLVKDEKDQDDPVTDR